MLNTIIQTALRNQGITYNLVTGETNPTQGYMVSLPDREVREEILTPENLIRFIAINADKFAENNKYLGIWQDGNWCLDVSANITHKEEAIKLAKKWNQKAIWDCAKGEAITIESDLNEWDIRTLEICLALKIEEDKKMLEKPFVKESEELTTHWQKEIENSHLLFEKLCGRK